jgi:HSP20 family protein
MAIMKREERRWLPDVFWPWSEEGQSLAQRLFDVTAPGGIRVEEYEKEGKHVIRAELPGIDPDKDVSVSVADGTLHISAERREESKEQAGKGYRSEFRYGTYRRSLPLPPGARESDVTATYTDGILEISFPVSEKTPATRSIPIKRS